MARLRSAPQNGGATDSEKQHNGTTDGPTAADPATDLQRWRLLDERGRQTWHYLTTDEDLEAWPQTTADKHHLGLPLVRSIAHFCSYTNVDIPWSRTCQTSRLPRHPVPPPIMRFRSSPTSSYRQVTGLASMEDPCFSCQVW